MRQLLPTSLELQLGELLLGNLGVRDHRAAFGSAERHHREREPSLGTRSAAGIFEPESCTRPFENPPDTCHRLVGVGGAHAGGAPADIEVTAADAGLGIRRASVVAS